MASRKRVPRWTLVAGIFVGCSGAMAQVPVLPDPAPAPAAAAPPEQPADPLDFRLPPLEWTVRIEPRAWWASPSGEIKLPAASGSGAGGGGGGGAGGGLFTDSGNHVDVSRLNLDTPRLSAAGEVQIAAGNWRFGFSAGAYSLDRDETHADSSFRIGSVEVSPGELLSVRMEYSTFELTLGYEVWSRDFRKASKEQERAVEAGVRLVLLGGARIHDLDVAVASLDDATSAGTDQTYFEPMGGARVELELIRQFLITFQASGGAWAESDRSVYSFDMQVAFRWEPVRNFGAEIGWRQMLFSMSDGKDTGEFEYVGGMAGVFAGVTIRF